MAVVKTKFSKLTPRVQEAATSTKTLDRKMRKVTRTMRTIAELLEALHMSHQHTLRPVKYTVPRITGCAARRKAKTIKHEVGPGGRRPKRFHCGERMRLLPTNMPGRRPVRRCWRCKHESS